jgi:hypothetical protein
MGSKFLLLISLIVPIIDGKAKQFACEACIGFRLEKLEFQARNYREDGQRGYEIAHVVADTHALSLP